MGLRTERGGLLAARVPGVVVKFTVSSLVALAVVGIGGGLALRRTAEAESVRDARQLTKIAGEGLVEPVLEDSLLRGDPAALAKLDEVIRERVLGDPVVRVKIWTPDGRIVYSDEGRLVGSTYPLDNGEREALVSGVASADITGLDAAENQFEQSDEDLLEVYHPVQTPGGHPLLFETYLRQSSVAAGGRKIWAAFIPPFVAALVLLALVQVPLAWSLARRLREGQRERELLLRRAIDASNTERKRIAGELHDGVVQDLAGISYSLSAAADRANGSTPAGVKEALQEGASVTRQSMRQLRSLLVDLYPPNLGREGLEPALRDLVEPLVVRGTSASVDVPTALELDRETEELVYSTAQEAVRNVLKHAEAHSVSVHVERDRARVRLVVEDDGRGIAPGEVGHRRAEGHLGLALLEDRAAGAGGRLTLSSAPGRGTRVCLEVPAPERRAGPRTRVEAASPALSSS
jgi:two-component system NarL family sensor kinase